MIPKLLGLFPTESSNWDHTVPIWARNITIWVPNIDSDHHPVGQPSWIGLWPAQPSWSSHLPPNTVIIITLSNVACGYYLFSLINHPNPKCKIIQYDSVLLLIMTIKPQLLLVNTVKTVLIHCKPSMLAPCFFVQQAAICRRQSQKALTRWSLLHMKPCGLWE